MPMHDWTRVKSGTYHNFHVLWLSTITNRLNAGVLPQGFFAMAEQVVGGPEPDVVTLQTEIPFKYGSDAGVALAVEQPKPRTTFVLLAPEERFARKANHVSIRHELGEVVAVIELVSPGNKDSRHSLRSFIDKTVELLYHGVNLLVVDPFPPGTRDPQGIHGAIWEEVTDQPFALPPGRDRTIAAYQAAPIKTAYVEPIAVGDPLPRMPVFLQNEYYVELPLEETYQTTWDVLPNELKRLVTN